LRRYRTLLAKTTSPEDDKIQLIFSKIKGPLKFEKSRMLARFSSSELQHIPNNAAKIMVEKNTTLDNVCNVQFSVSLAKFETSSRKTISPTVDQIRDKVCKDKFI
jgi:hypothetical protein